MRRAVVLGEEIMVVRVCCNETHFAVFLRYLVRDDEITRVRLYGLHDLTQIGEEVEIGAGEMELGAGYRDFGVFSCAMGKSVIAAVCRWTTWNGKVEQIGKLEYNCNMELEGRKSFFR